MLSILFLLKSIYVIFFKAFLPEEVINPLVPDILQLEKFNLLKFGHFEKSGNVVIPPIFNPEKLNSVSFLHVAELKYLLGTSI